MTRVINGILCGMCLVLAGCASYQAAGLCEGLDRSVKAYNRMLRWHEIENAGMTYMEPEQHEEFFRQVETLKKRGVSVTDYRILSSQCSLEKKSGDALAEFDYYLLPSNRIKTISYRQEWLYHEDTRSWKTKSRLPVIE